MRVATVGTGKGWSVGERFSALLDIDGTLVDSNYHHALAWQRALRRAGVEALMTDLHRSIGMGGDHMVQRFAAGLDAPVEDWWHEEFLPLRTELRPTPGAGTLIRDLADAGATNVYATSGQAADVDALRALIGADRWIAAAVNSSEVAASKPAPDIFELAMRRVDADRSRTVVVGDSRWDVEAATAAGVACIALTCGGISEGELTAAGARAVYETPQHLAADLADALAGVWR
jgi:phosphoglycolate phosphatase-like HAD superfamily hydrolase